MIAGLPKAPSAFNPITNPTRARERRDWILGRMLELGYIDAQRHAEAVAFVDDARYHGSDIELNAPYIAEMVRQQLFERYGEALYTDGYRVWTTVTSQQQREAIDALRRGLLAYSDRHGYHGARSQSGARQPEQQGRSTQPAAPVPHLCRSGAGAGPVRFGPLRPTATAQRRDGRAGMERHQMGAPLS